MTHSTAAAVNPIKVGIIADQTGPLSFVGLANANVARIVPARVVVSVGAAFIGAVFRVAPAPPPGLLLILGHLHRTATDRHEKGVDVLQF